MAADVTAKKGQSVVLFIPNTKWKKEDTFLSIPHSIAVLSAILKTAFDVSLLDATGSDLTEDECKEFLRKTRPEAVLFSGLATFQHPKSIHYSTEIVKSVCPDSITVLGGVYPTVQPEVALKDRNIDYVFLGHAEERVIEFLEAALDGSEEKAKTLPGIGFRDKDSGVVTVNPVRTVISQIKRQVQPDYSLLQLEPYLRQAENLGTNRSNSLKVAPLLTSYGCPYKCTFCATRTISGRSVAYRPLKDVFEEIDYFHNEYKVDQVMFYDDNLLLKRERMVEICNAFIAGRWNGMSWKTGGLMAFLLDHPLLELMAKAGCTEIRISVESGSERVSKELVKKPIVLSDIPGIVKKCHEVGILIRGAFVIGFPGETWEELRQTFRFAEDCDFDLVHFLIATPLPNTELFDMAVNTGSLLPGFELVDPEFTGWNTGFIQTDEFTPQELAILRTYEWDRINFKSREKCETIAGMYNMSLEQLEEHRRKTRRALGALSMTNKEEAPQIEIAAPVRDRPLVNGGELTSGYQYE